VRLFVERFSCNRVREMTHLPVIGGIMTQFPMISEIMTHFAMFGGRVSYSLEIIINIYKLVNKWHPLYCNEFAVRGKI